GLDNLPLGIFSTPGTSRRSGVAVGDRVLDLAAVTGDLVHATGTLNAFLARGAPRLGRAARTGHRLAHRGAAPAGRRAAPAAAVVGEPAPAGRDRRLRRLLQLRAPRGQPRADPAP